MPYTLQDFRKDYVRARLDWLTVEERVAGLPPEQVLPHYKPEERLAGLAPEDILAGLKPDDRQWLAKLLDTKQDGKPDVTDSE